MKKFLKTKKMRKAIKAARIEYRQQAKRDKIRHVRQTELCSTCDPLNCICRDNQRASRLIAIFSSATIMLIILLCSCTSKIVAPKAEPPKNVSPKIKSDVWK